MNILDVRTCFIYNKFGAAILVYVILPNAFAAVSFRASAFRIRSSLNPSEAVKYKKETKNM